MKHLRPASSIAPRSLRRAVHKAGLVTLMAVVLVCTVTPAWAAPATQDSWKRIEYLPLSVPWSTDGKAHTSLQPDANGLRLDIMMATKDDQAGNLPAKGQLRVRLHREVGPTEFTAIDAPMGTGSMGYLQWHYMHIFPWGQDRLADTWLELQVGERTFWLEIPYGLDRKPGPASADAVDVSAVPAGSPKLAVAMGDLTDGAVIVPWRHVHYEVGEIQNGWHLAVLQSNPFDAMTELVLYRNDAGEGSSMYLWDLHEPRTSVAITPDDERTVHGRCLQLRLHTDGMRRSDKFALSRNHSDERGWATMKISVGPHDHQLVLPSSLFRYTHGIAEPHHPARIK